MASATIDYTKACSLAQPVLLPNGAVDGAWHQDPFIEDHIAGFLSSTCRNCGRMINLEGGETHWWHLSVVLATNQPESENPSVATGEVETGSGA